MDPFKYCYQQFQLGHPDRYLYPYYKKDIENGSITPENFYGQLKPDLKMGAYISLDKAVDLYLANTVDTGNLRDSWRLNSVC